MNEKIMKKVGFEKEVEAVRNKPLTYKKITGYVGRNPVVAYVYPGSDSGLNHYRIDGKTKMGTVEFTTISKEEEIEY